MDTPIPRQILIVEDNQTLARGMSIILKDAGFEVEIAHDGPEALRVSRAHRPDLVLLDIGLPGMDGFQIADEMRSDPVLKNIKIIALSGYDQDTLPALGERSRFDHHLVKPVDFQKVSAFLARVI